MWSVQGAPSLGAPCCFVQRALKISLSQGLTCTACGTSISGTSRHLSRCFEANLFRSATMRDLFAQGDLLIERVDPLQPSGSFPAPNADGSYVLAEGELTGHSHAIFGSVMMFRDDGLARDIPGGLYIGHINVEGPLAR